MFMMSIGQLENLTFTGCEKQERHRKTANTCFSGWMAEPGQNTKNCSEGMA